MEEERFYIAENERIWKDNGLTDGFYHYDTPFFTQTQIDLLSEAGFNKVTIHKEWDNTSIIICSKS